MQRKIREAILARRIEAKLLEARHPHALPEPDLPRHTAPTASAAAARRYFDKAVGELDLGEMATLAGPRARAVALLAPDQHRAGARAARSGAGAPWSASGSLTDDEANKLARAAA